MFWRLAPSQVKPSKETAVRSRKRCSIEEAARTPKEASVPVSFAKLETNNLFSPFGTANMDTDAPRRQSSVGEGQFQQNRASCLNTVNIWNKPYPVAEITERRGQANFWVP
jgi:hypothetical protein